MRQDFRHQLAERADDDIERTTGKTEAKQEARRNVEFERRGRISHHHEAGRIKQRADTQHAHRAVAIRDRAREGLADAPEQNFASPARKKKHRGPSHARATAASEIDRPRSAAREQRADEASAQNDDDRRAPGRNERSHRLSRCAHWLLRRPAGGLAVIACILGFRPERRRRVGVLTSFGRHLKAGWKYAEESVIFRFARLENKPPASRRFIWPLYILNLSISEFNRWRLALA